MVTRESFTSMMNEILDILEELNKAHLRNDEKEFKVLTKELKDATNLFAKHTAKK